MIDINEMTVLVADDMEMMFKSLRSIMRVLKFGRKFIYARDGEDALEILKTQEIDLAILDNNMPGITGVELLSIIRNEKNLRDMPVIMITADATMECVTKAAETDIDAYILKPITLELLRNKISEVIDTANNPPPMVVHLKNASQNEEKGDLESAINEAKLAKDANPNSSRPIRELGLYLLKKGEMKEAEKQLLKAVKMNKIDVVALHHLGDLYHRQDNIDAALKYFYKAVEISPLNLERGLTLGRNFIQKGMIDEALPVLNKVFQLSKEPLKLKEEIADLCMQKGAKSYASKLLKDVISVDRSRRDTLLKLALLAKEAGEKEESMAHLIEAERLDDRNINIKICIAKNYISQNQFIRAEKPINQILNIDPNHQEAKELLQQCI